MLKLIYCSNVQVHNAIWWQRSIQSLRKIHWTIAEKNSGQNRTDGRTDRQTDGRTDRQTGWFQYTPPLQLVGGGNNEAFAPNSSISLLFSTMFFPKSVKLHIYQIIGKPRTSIAIFTSSHFFIYIYIKTLQW